MIWHILRKDCRALTRGIWAVALINAISTAIWIGLGPLAGGTQMYSNAMFISGLALACMLLLTSLAVLQDAPSANEQDWRVRPIKRRDLVAAKLLFAILAVHAPLFVLDFVGGVAQGFGALPSAGAALARGSAIFLSLTLLAIVLATFARDVSGLIRVAVGVALLLLLLAVAVQQLVPAKPNYAGTGLAWIPTFATFILIIVAAAVILPLRYRSRRTVSALIVGASAIVLSIASAVLPWEVSFSIQRAFAAAQLPDAAATFRFDPAAGRSDANFSSLGIIRVPIPLHVSGIPQDAILQIENAAVRIRDAQGSVIYAGNSCVKRDRFSGADCTAANFRVRARGSSGEVRFHYPVGLPDVVYEPVRNEPLRLELDYYISLLVLDAVTMVGAEGTRTPWCATQREFDRIQSRCLNTVAVPACTRVEGPYNSVHRMVPESEHCRPDYAPLHFNRFPDVVLRRQDNFWFPPTGSSPDSISGYGTDLMPDEERLAVKTYRAQSHFKRRTVIESVRLADWGG